MRNYSLAWAAGLIRINSRCLLYISFTSDVIECHGVFIYSITALRLNLPLGIAISVRARRETSARYQEHVKSVFLSLLGGSGENEV